MNNENINNSEEYSQPYMKVIEFDMQDIITASPYPPCVDGCQEDITDPF